MTDEIIAFVMYLSFLLIALLAAGILAAIFSAVIMYGFPNSDLAAWLDGVWFDKESPDEIFNCKVGDCISGKKWRER